jgi:N-acetylglucosaminyldiphosphoundecaprenol N-acetyl-beta-D-mannosaminyltransferase
MNNYPISVECLGYSVFTGNLDFLQNEKKTVISTINQYSYCMAEKDANFKKSLMESDILLPDGIGIVAAAKFLKGEKLTKIAGTDLHSFLLKRLDKQSGRCFYLGSSERTLSKIRKRMAKDFPKIEVGTYSPPFKANFSDEDNAKMLSQVNAFKPDVLFVGMTAPKQEKWAFAHKEQLNASIICSIGAVFDFYACTMKRPGKIWIKFGLEWLGRLIKEPKRMWKRYLYYGLVFGYYILQKKVDQLTQSPEQHGHKDNKRMLQNS